MPEYMEAAMVMANPTRVMLYCGYAYESGLIAESFTTAVLAEGKQFLSAVYTSVSGDCLYFLDGLDAYIGKLRKYAPSA